MVRHWIGAVAALCAWSLTACSRHYSRHMSETYKDAKLEAKTFAILPLMDIDYRPPSNCFGSGGSGTGAQYEKPWNAAVEKSLKTAFAKHTFRLYDAAELEELKIDAPSLYSQAGDEIMGMGVADLGSSPETPKLAYEPARAAGKVGRVIRALHDSDKVDYVIMLVSPKMTGEVHTSHNAQGGMSYHTVYTSDVQFGVWAAESGELAYASGSIAASSGFCFFVSPQQGSIDGASGDMTTQLKALIARILQEEAERVARAGRTAALAR